MNMTTKPLTPTFRTLGVFVLNSFLFFLVFFFSLPIAKWSPHGTAFLFFAMGASSFFWTFNVLVTSLPAAISFLLAFGNYSSSIVFNDTGGKGKLSLWSAIGSMSRQNVESLLVAVLAATIGWLLGYWILRNRMDLVQRARPYVLSMIVGLVVLCLIVLILKR